jgi:hypothetical protein
MLKELRDAHVTSSGLAVCWLFYVSLSSPRFVCLFSAFPVRGSYTHYAAQNLKKAFDIPKHVGFRKTCPKHSVASVCD